MIWLIALVAVGYLTVPRSYRPVQRRARKRRRTKKRAPIDMGAIVTEVATRLRSGSSPQLAWRATLQNAGLLPAADDAGFHELDAETVLDETGVPVALRDLNGAGWLARRKAGIDDVVRSTFPATFAVCTMSYSTGAPMAQVLEACAEGITETGEARSAREVALAGPRSSARMLALLPLFGLAIGWTLGADPFGFLTGNLLGRITLLVGLAFEAAGIVWTRQMVAKARAESE